LLENGILGNVYAKFNVKAVNETFLKQCFITISYLQGLIFM